MIPDLKDLAYEQRLAKTKSWTLEDRRIRADLVEVYKIIHGLSTTVKPRSHRRDATTFGLLATCKKCMHIHPADNYVIALGVNGALVRTYSSNSVIMYSIVNDVISTGVVW